MDKQLEKIKAQNCRLFVHHCNFADPSFASRLMTVYTVSQPCFNQHDRANMLYQVNDISVCACPVILEDANIFPRHVIARVAKALVKNNRRKPRHFNGGG